MPKSRQHFHPASTPEGEGVHDSGKTGTGIRGRLRDMDVEEGTGKEIGVSSNANATMDVRSYGAEGGGREEGLGEDGWIE